MRISNSVVSVLLVLTLSVPIAARAEFRGSDERTEIAEANRELSDSGGSLSVPLDDDVPPGTCRADYQKYHRQMALKSGLSLPVAFAGGTVALYLGGTLGAGIGSLVDGTGGWNSVIGAIIGLEITGVGTVVSYAIVQTDSLVRLIHSGTMKRVIDEAAATDRGASPGKALLRFHRRLIRKHPELSSSTPEQTAKILVQLDATRALCDGSLKAKKKLPRKPKLKHLLATPAEARNAVAALLEKN
ncbi:MAG: hypothetical protein JST04_18345 [Bdellovibrionales bacterium]|nr:hypothetical protein [Bdellovibrionales bacterium]